MYRLVRWPVEMGWHLSLPGKGKCRWPWVEGGLWLSPLGWHTHTHSPALSPATAKNKSPRHNTAATWGTASKQINDAAHPRSPGRRWGDEQTNLWSMPAGREVSEELGFQGHTTLQQTPLSSAAISSWTWAERSSRPHSPCSPPVPGWGCLQHRGLGLKPPGRDPSSPRTCMSHAGVLPEATSTLFRTYICPDTYFI